MAITKAFPGIGASVCVDGEPLQEYADETVKDNDGTVTRYIEAISKKPFEVHLEVKKETSISHSAVYFEVFMDGKFVHNPLIPKSFIEWDCGASVVEGKELANGMVQKLMFAEVDTVSDDRSLLNKTPERSEIGTIAVVISFVDLLEVRSVPAATSALTGFDTVSEKAAKGEAITHSVDFGDPESSESGPSQQYDTGNRDDSDNLKIIFKYRSKDALQRMRILPRSSPSPSPAPELDEPVPLEDRDPATLSIAEIMQLQQSSLSHAANKDATVRIKRERNNDNPRPQRKRARVSRGSTYFELDEEEGMRELSTDTLQSEESPEVIDLT